MMTMLVQKFRPTGAAPWRHSPGTQLCLAAAGVTVGLALLGSFFAPYDPNALAGAPLASPSRQFLLGTDALGRDVLSRILWGGRTLLALAIASMLIAYILGGTIGLIAGYRRTLISPLLMRAMDVLLAFPPLILI